MEDICSICHCDYESIDEKYITTCDHNFHKCCIKTWHKSGHTSCNLCPLCRSPLNIIEIEPFDSNLQITYEEFIKLDGVYVHGSYILIKMNSLNWKNLLKNMLVLITISQHQETLEHINRTKLFIKGTDMNRSFGFILEDVQFIVHKHMGNFGNIGKPKIMLSKIMLSKIDDTQFQNLKCLDKILLEITNNNSSEFSFIRKKYIRTDDEDDIDDTPITHDNAKIITSVFPFARQYDIANHAACNYEDYLRGQCCVALIPEVINVRSNTFYQLKCIDFALINGIVKNSYDKQKFSSIFGDK